MGKLYYIFCLLGLIFGSVGLRAATPAGRFVFVFAKGSTAVDPAMSTNAATVQALATPFDGSNFLHLSSIEVIGQIDAQGNLSANEVAAQARAEATAAFLQRRYSWIFVDNRLPIFVRTAPTTGGSRSVVVRLNYQDALASAPVLEPAAEPQVQPQQQPQVQTQPAPTLQVVSESTATQGSHRDSFSTPAPAPRTLRFEEPRPVYAAIKTNLLFDAVLALNFEVEVPLTDHWSVQASLVFPAWNFSNRYCLKILETSVEGRYWFDPIRQERLTGHSVGAYAHLIASYDVQWNRNGSMGKGYGFGLTYGYAHRIGRELGLEYALGVGAVYLENRSYRVNEGFEQKELLGQSAGWRILPTRAKVSLVWRIGGQKKSSR